MSFTYDITMFKETFESEFTWLNGFLRNVSRFGDRDALFDPLCSQKWTYRELNAACNKFANAMKNKGVGKSDIVFYQLYNSPYFVFSYIAPQKLGAISNPANFNLSPGETAEIINHNKPAVYVYDSSITDTAVKALKIAKHKPKIVIMADYMKLCEKAPEGHVKYEDFVAAQSENDPPIDFNPHIYDEVLRLQTSGTTGTPKGVPLNNINEVLSAHDVMMHFPLSPYDKTMNMTPWFHRGGIHSGGLTPTLYAGAEVIIMRDFHPKTTLSYVEKYGITFLIGVPSVLGLLATRQEKHPKDISSLKGIITMGSPLEKQECIRFQETLTPNIFNGYGTTESFWNTFLRPQDLPEMSGTAGRSCTDDEVRLVKVFDDRKAEPEDVIPNDGKSEGEIIIKCPAKTTYCYANNKEVTKEKFYKGWMYTGDIGTWDEKHFVTVAGRKDDMIISKGENIYPARIEEAINEFERVKDCIVTSVPDKTRGEAVAAYIIPADDELTVKEVLEFCKNSPNLSKYQVPRYFRLIDTYPTTATGKKQHYKMKAQAKEDMENGLLLRK